VAQRRTCLLPDARALTTAGTAAGPRSQDDCSAQADGVVFHGKGGDHNRNRRLPIRTSAAPRCRVSIPDRSNRHPGCGPGDGPRGIRAARRHGSATCRHRTAPEGHSRYRAEKEPSPRSRDSAAASTDANLRPGGVQVAAASSERHAISSSWV
jgi:hypothetical protein